GPAHAIRRGRRRRRRIIGGVASLLVAAVVAGVAGTGQLSDRPPRPVAPPGVPSTTVPPEVRADPVPDEVAAQLWEDTKSALRACEVGKAAGPRLIAQGTAYGNAWVLGARPPRAGKGMCWASGESGPGGGGQIGGNGSAGSPSRKVVASGSSGDSHGSVYGYVTKEAALVRVVFNDGRKPLEVTPVRAGPQFPVDFYIAYYPQQGASGGWRVARVLALDKDGRVLASCRTRDTCAED
ncbi:MAG TPA: hypothetical protein VG499_13120, partial [Actinomycetota bacterium]|nr:hypothetical protein [Actinomycetota bacterium]